MNVLRKKTVARSALRGLLIPLLSWSALAAATPSFAQQVFTGDPVDPSTGAAYPIMPGLPLLLPGNDDRFGTGDDVIDATKSGDIDLVVRAAVVVSSAIPPPALAPGGPPIASVVAGGGSSGQGAEAAFTVMASDGTGTYGNVTTGSDLDLRPVTVYAFADLDGDGIIGPTNGDGSTDNAFELQEATAYAGRQMGSFESGRFTDSLGLEIGAPASIGGLTVALTAGAWTGNDPEAIFTDGPLILTRWPFFPPLDPKDLLGGGHAPAPDPTAPSQLEWDIERNYLPAPGHPSLGTPFAVSTTGSEPTTDQLHVRSAAAVSARVFAEPAASKFRARARPVLRVAPAIGGGGRTIVMPVGRAVLAADAGASQLTLRVLPVDLFANVADPASPIPVTLALGGAASIVSPDEDGNPKTETLELASAEGVAIVLDDAGTGSARLVVSAGGVPVQTVALGIEASVDSDGDGVVDDGNASSLSGDFPCDAATASCDDNCPRVLNPSQIDTDHDGIGDCCDGTCILDPLSTACDECALPANPGPSSGALSGAALKVRIGDDDRLGVKLAFDLPVDAEIAPDVETVTLIATQAGSGGFAIALPSLFVDLLRAAPSYRYVDRSAAVDGVTKGQIKGSVDGSYKMALKAAAPSLVDLTAGPATLTLAIGDDLFEGTLDCTGTGTRLSCSLVP